MFDTARRVLMPSSDTCADAVLPASHYFLSIARGASIRTLRVPFAALWACAGVGAALACWLVGASLYLAFHDDLIAALMSREAHMQYAYEDRIAALRGQVEHESTLRLVSGESFDKQVAALALRATTLESRATLVGQLAGRLEGSRQDRTTTAAAPAPGRLGGVVGAKSRVTSTVVDMPTNAAPSSRFAPVPADDKPHPEAFLGDGPGRRDEVTSPSRRLANLTETLERIDGSQYAAVAAIDAAARKRTTALRDIVLDAGLSLDRLRPPVQPAGTGGPFVPLDDAATMAPFGRALASVQKDVAEADHLRRAIPTLPLATPVSGSLEISSPFGARVDPFLGRAAMHTGVDFREDYGIDIKATAHGRVVTAGPTGGYGSMVEVDHGNGLTTRYAHMSEILVEVGQSVSVGSVLGRVGASGRATGPHLHYETRIDGEPVDPIRFIKAGERLEALGDTP